MLPHSQPILKPGTLASAYTYIHGTHAIRESILDLIGMEPRNASVPSAPPRARYSFIGERGACLPKAAPISESSLEKLTLVRSDSAIVFSGFDFNRSSVPRFGT